MLKNKILNIFFIFIVLNITLNAMKVSNIRGIEKLSNYNEIKNVEIERIIDYDNYERNKEKDRVYVNGEDKPFTGAAIRKKNGRIIGIYTYINGKSEGKHYKYFDNSDAIKYDCEETSKDNWTCKEYNKNGSFKRNIENGKAYVAVNNNHHGNFWINMFLGAWNILTQTH